MSLPSRTALLAAGAIVGALAIFALAGKFKAAQAKREASDSSSKDIVGVGDNSENGGTGTPKIYGSGTVGGAPTTPSLTAVEIARAAALRRQSDRAVLMSEGSLKAAEKKEKASIIGKIEECYAKIDKDPPIGLAASKLESLHRHLDYIRKQVLLPENQKKGKIFHFQGKPAPDPGLVDDGHGGMKQKAVVSGEMANGGVSSTSAAKEMRSVD